MQATGPLERRWWKGKGVTLKHVKEALIELLVTRYHSLSFSLSLSHTLSLSLTVTHPHSPTLTRSITRTHTFSLSTIQAPSRSLSPSSNEMSYFYPILVKIEKTFPLGHIIHSNQDSDGKKTGTEYPSSGLLLLS